MRIGTFAANFQERSPPILKRFSQQKCDRSRSENLYIAGNPDALRAIVHAIGGIEDHIHIVASIPPTLSLADFVKNLKGSSTHHLNQSEAAANFNNFGWQDGYGVFSLGSTQLEQAVTYVLNQKIHHLNGPAIASLEKYERHDDAPEPWRPK